MSAETMLYSTLSVAAPVIAVVGTRIFPDVVPQDKVLPAIAFVRADTEFATTIHGTVGRTRAVVEVWSMASTRTAADALAGLALTALLPALFIPQGKRPEDDLESDPPIYSTVLTYSIWE